MKRKTQKRQLFIPKLSNFDKERLSDIKSKEPDDIEVKVHNKQIDNKIRRNTWLRIECGSRVIYRVVRGTTAKGLTADKIWLSYDSRRELDADERCTLHVRPCTKRERLFKAPQNSPDPFMRAQFYLSIWISLIGVITGLLGVLLAIMSIIICK